jgi:hypothetical protein
LPFVIFVFFVVQFFRDGALVGANEAYASRNPLVMG